MIMHILRERGHGFPGFLCTIQRLFVRFKGVQHSRRITKSHKSKAGLLSREITRVTKHTSWQSSLVLYEAPTLALNPNGFFLLPTPRPQREPFAYLTFWYHVTFHEICQTETLNASAGRPSTYARKSVIVGMPSWLGSNDRERGVFHNDSHEKNVSNLFPMSSKFCSTNFTIRF